MEVDLDGCFDGQIAKRGDHTGPNPTDRAKRGVKRHMLTDGRGVSLSVVITATISHYFTWHADSLRINRREVLGEFPDRL